MPLSSLLQRLATLILGPRGPMRVRYAPSAVALVSYLLLAVLQQGAVYLGLMTQAAYNLHTGVTLSGAGVLFVLVRSGWSRRFTSDPSLTVPQMLFGMITLTWSYAISGPARGAVLSLMILVILYGVFDLKPAVARRLSLTGFLMLAMTMAWRAGTNAEYDPRVELIHFVYMAIVMAATSSLAITVGRLRAKLATQKKELKAALALNRELATRDALTGLLNRRAMVEVLAHEQSRVDRGADAVSLALIDIDWFKRINDDHGHGVGDTVLQRFTVVLEDEMRTSDALARWGGEEFLLLMPEADLCAANRVVDRMRNRLEREDLSDISPTLKLTFSAGVAQFVRGECYTATIDRADQALYRAKESGRNRVEMG
ncbi:MAG: diguanylate cyclase [Rhodoferax sp.]